ncbi:hypothetical protein LQ948_16725 [Jiella sp. MQZ9-1]|uniref:Ubiquinol-cytochrome c chaperone domain-containing protein n=1 Tax=Jiella flava TaxID=2816857 RepID=A0A939FY83_9HYPH|nr:ubiquinol-cytochrome C chaperone family protein [Jiella flava]MBO0664208.1 hypothetical protein [Jiella flava]MCD2472854.1 hypothetical protein [Jiella flava]
MMERWRIARRNRAIVEDIFQAIVALTRQPRLYADLGVADTFSGRFEALSLHVFLFLRRCRSETGLEALAQDLVDRFVADVDYTIRELGIGDQSVPKRMRKLTGVFYERVRVYHAAFDAAEPQPALAEALLSRAIELDAAAPRDAAAALATYMIETDRRFGAIASKAILAGRLELTE